MSDITRYTLGFFFNASLTQTALVRKKFGPPFMRGLLNGVGGKIETPETPINGMWRELAEEFHVDKSKVHQIRPMGVYLHTAPEATGEVHLYAIQGVKESLSPLPLFNDVGERVEVYTAAGLPDDTVPNLRWLVPLSKHFLQMGGNSMVCDFKVLER